MDDQDHGIITSTPKPKPIRFKDEEILQCRL